MTNSRAMAGVCLSGSASLYIQIPAGRIAGVHPTCRTLILSVFPLQAIFIDLIDRIALDN